MIHGGVNVARIGLVPPRDDAWRARLAIPSGAILFGSAGRLVNEKAYEVFVDAAACLVRAGAEIHFAIAGDGPLRDTLAAEISRRGLSERFHLVGYEPDIRAYLAQLDVFVLASRSEAFPLALVEALAAGRPCIGTNVGGIPEMLGDGGGLIVPPESPERLSEAMRMMLVRGDAEVLWPTRPRYRSAILLRVLCRTVP